MKSKRGITLSELCVVMAVVGIIGAMVVSFCVLISANLGRISEANHIRQDFDLIDTALDRFVSEFDSAEYVFSGSPDGSLTAARPNASGAGAYRLYFSADGNTLKGELPDGRELSYPMSATVGAEFFVRGEGGASPLVVCRATYLKTASATGVKLRKQEEFFKAVRAAATP